MERASVLTQRASDADRDRVIALLRDASVAGRLSHDTFVGRLERALAARERAELAQLVHDISPGRQSTGKVEAAVSALSGFTARLERAWRAPRLPKLQLPNVGADRLTVGRSSDQDLLLAHSSVSRRHALLRRSARGWEVVDLASTNGTRVNGWLVAAPEVIQTGDVVAFGAVAMLVTDPARCSASALRFS